MAVLAGDMADASLPQKAVDLANERWGRIDSLIVNHGTLDPVKKVADSSPEEWRKGFDVNVFSAVGMVSPSLVLFYPFLRLSTILTQTFNINITYPGLMQGTNPLLYLGTSRPPLPAQNLRHNPPYLLWRRNIRLPRLGLLRRG